MYEALQRLRFEAFLDTLDEEYQESIFSLIITMQDSFTEGRFQECMKSQLFDNIVIKYETFVAESSTKSKTFAYWSMYTKMVGKDVFNSSGFTILFHICKVNIIYFLTQFKDMLESHNYISLQAYFRCSFEQQGKLIGICICLQLDQ